MFALMLCTQYEGSDLLGVYSTLDRAVEAAGAYGKATRMFDDWLEVHGLELDGAVSHGFDRAAVWSSVED